MSDRVLSGGNPQVPIAWLNGSGIPRRATPPDLRPLPPQAEPRFPSGRLNAWTDKRLRMSGSASPTSPTTTSGYSPPAGLAHLRVAQPCKATKINNRNLCDKHVVPLLGALKLRDLTAPKVDAWLVGLSATLSTRTLQMVRSCLNRSVKRAMARDWVKRNVVELTEVPAGQPGRCVEALRSQRVQQAQDRLVGGTVDRDRTGVHHGRRHRHECAQRTSRLSPGPGPGARPRPRRVDPVNCATLSSRCCRMLACQLRRSPASSDTAAAASPSCVSSADQACHSDRRDGHGSVVQPAEFRCVVIHFRIGHSPRNARAAWA